MGSRKNISFDHFNKTIEDLKAVLKKEQQKHHKEMTDLIKELKDDLQEEKNKKSKLTDKVAVMKKQVSFMKSALSKTTVLAEENEQYSRRENLIIKNIKPADHGAKESADDVLDKVKTAIGKLSAEGKVVISAHAIDRAHRVGKRWTSEKYGEQHNVIVRFTSWSERTAVYKARKDSGLVISLDITYARQKLLNEVRDKLITKYTDAEFACSDVNCNLVIKFGVGGFRRFDSWNEASNLCQKFGGVVEGDEDDDEDDEDEESDNEESDEA